MGSYVEEVWALCGACGGASLNRGAVFQLQRSESAGYGAQTTSLEKGLRCWERVTCIFPGVHVCGLLQCSMLRHPIAHLEDSCVVRCRTVGGQSH